MLQQLSSGILYAIGFFLSVWFNLRHTEDATHPLWTMYLLYLCGIKNIGILIPTPQFRLYVTHNVDNLHGTEQPESISAASATLTAALPRGSWEVIPDFCILLPRAVLKNPQRRMSMNSFLESINMTTSLPTHEIRIVSTAVPLLAELKHAPSRHPADIEAYRDDIMKLIPPAQGQVMAQADCLFCSPKFRDTNEVMLIAAAGDWWTFRLYERAECEFLFNTADYFTRMKGEWKVDNPSEDEDDTLLDPEQIAGLNVAQQAEETYGQRIERQKQERDSRANERAQCTEQRAELFATYREFIVMQKNGPYTDAQLDRLELLEGHYTLGPQKTSTFTQPPRPRHSPLDDTMTIGKWSKPMRIGSMASHQYAEYISDKLGKLVEQENRERKRCPPL